MILPTKHIAQDRALLTVGARILSSLSTSKTISALWEDITRAGNKKEIDNATLRFDAFILALDLLFLLGAIDFQDGLINRTNL